LSGSDVVDGAQSIGLRFTPGYVDWNATNIAGYVSPVPEPATFSQIFCGLVLLWGARRRAEGSRDRSR